ncbi:MAG: hypothetical protein AABX39_01715, partial [Nanoarchaeota archaeon]
MGKRTKKSVKRVVPSFEVIILLAVLLTAVLSLAYYFSSSDNLLSGYQTASQTKKTFDLTDQTGKARDGVMRAGMQLAGKKILAQVYLGDAPEEQPASSVTQPETPVAPSDTTTPSTGGETQAPEPSTSQPSGPLQPFVLPPAQPYYPRPEQPFDYSSTPVTDGTTLTNVSESNTTQAENATNISAPSPTVSPTATTAPTESPSPTATESPSPAPTTTAVPTISPAPTVTVSP